MHCATCKQEVGDDAFTGDVCPACHHLIHPTRLGIYEDLELIKRGGMGAVYRATHPELGTQVAIKVVSVDPEIEAHRERFEREARIAAKIHNPGVVRVYDVDLRGGRLYLVMEYVDGRTLRQCLSDLGSSSPDGVVRHLDKNWVIEKVTQLCDVLHAAHSVGVIHRDVKPENIMIDSRGDVRVLDFGISRLTDSDERLTRTGEILGTPEYISPEQILDVPEAVDSRTDVYACGVVLYELLTGKSPFAGSNIFQVLKFVEALQPPPPSSLRSELTAEIDDLVLSAMSKSMAERPASCAEFASRLRLVGDESADAGAEHRRGSLSALMIAIAVVGMLIGWGAAAGPMVGPPRTVGQAGDQEPPIRAAAQQIERMLGGEPEQVDLSNLQVMSMMIADEAPAQDLYWRGRARKHTGALFGALRDLEAAHAASIDGADAQVRVLRSFVGYLYPLLLDGPLWLAAIDPGLASLEGYEVNAVDRLIVTVTDLALGGRRSAAAELLASSEIPHSAYAPLAMLRAAFEDPQQRLRTIEELIERIDRTAAMRYFLEIVLATQRRDSNRLKAASEMAVVVGEADRATAVYVACTLWCGVTADWPHLDALAGDLGGLPGSEVSRFLLAMAMGDSQAAKDRLGLVPLGDLHGLAAFQNWRALGLDDSFYKAWFESLGDESAGFQKWILDAGTESEVAVAKVCIAVAAIGTGSALSLKPELETAVSDSLAALVVSGSDLDEFFSHAAGMRRGSQFDDWVSTSMMEAARSIVRGGVQTERIRFLVRAARYLGHDVDTVIAEEGWGGILGR